MNIFDDKKYLGSGVAMPTELVGGRAGYAAGKVLVEQSLITLLNTPLGSRFMLRSYGCRIHELLFEPNDDILSEMGRFFISEAIRRWEKRVKFVSAEFSREDAKTLFEIHYTIPPYDEINSFVFPFYSKILN